MPAGLIALALGGFGIGLTEFVIMGLLPEVAADLAVSEVQAGWLITGYALTVAVGALLMTAALQCVDRKRALAGLVVLFIAGNLLSALGPTFTLVLAGRIVSALCHGAFFGIGSVVAASLVPADKKAGAIATMFTGLTVANVLGVPLGTFIGQAWGWRTTFVVIAGVGMLALAGIWALVPAGAARPADGTDAPTLRHEMAAFREPQVWWSVVLTILGAGGMFGSFAYIAFTLTDVSGFASSSVPWLLVLFGIGLLLGNLLGGRAADRSVPRTLAVTFVALTVVLVAFALGAQSRPATAVLLFAMGAFGFAAVPPLQLRIMSFAPAAPTMASGANIGAFNVGNALATWIAGLTIGAGLGYTAPLWAGAAITTAALGALGLATLALRRARRRRTTRTTVSTTISNGAPPAGRGSLEESSTIITPEEIPA